MMTITIQLICDATTIVIEDWMRALSRDAIATKHVYIQDWIGGLDDTRIRSGAPKKDVQQEREITRGARELHKIGFTA
ncbi:MAG: hypothetical protein WA667_16670 [Candidatus Nitrosopolaris sp.]